MSIYKTGDEIFLPVVLRKGTINYYLALGDAVGPQLRKALEHALILEETANSRLTWMTYPETGRGHAFLDDGTRSLCGANIRDSCEKIVMSIICSTCNELERPFR